MTFALLTLVSCMGSVRLRYLEPAQVEIPAKIDSVAPIERVGSSLGTSAIQSAASRLAESPRFTVAEHAAAQEILNSSTPLKIGQAMPSKLAASICKRANTTGIVSLETFDATEAWKTWSEMRTVTETVTVDGEAHQVSRQVPVYGARVDVEVALFFRLYDCKAKVVDGHKVWNSYYSWAEGYSPGDAKSGVSDPYAAADRLGSELGSYYADIVAPHYVVVTREYFESGSPELREAASAVERDDWEGAAELWELALADENPRAQGKALYNLALAAERNGMLDDAVLKANAAHAALSSRDSLYYLTVLRKRQRDREALVGQMGSSSIE
jgi:hypothetical protein